MNPSDIQIMRNAQLRNCKLPTRGLARNPSPSFARPLTNFLAQLEDDCDDYCPDMDWQTVP
jgi:hypothetical protein